MSNYRYNPKQHNELIAKADGIKVKVEEFAKKINDRATTDKPATDADNRAYAADMAQHSVYSTQYESLMNQIHRMELLKPNTLNKEPSPLARFASTGLENLSESEKKTYTRSGPGIKPFTENAFEKDFGLTAEDMKGVRLPPGVVGADWFIDKLDVPEMFNALTRSDETPGGGDFHTSTTYPRLDQRLLAYSGVLATTSYMATSHGNLIEFPHIDDTNQKGEYFTDQSSSASQQDLANIGHKDLETQIISSGAVDVSYAVLQDTLAFNLENIIRQLLRRRIARGTCEAVIKGDGANKTPRGMITDAADGVQAASETLPTPKECSQLIDEIDPAYIEVSEGSPAGLPSLGGRTGVVWTVNSKTKGIFRTFVGTDGHPVFLPSIRAGDPDRLYGYPIIVDNAMPIAPNAPDDKEQKIIMFGNNGYWMFREIPTIIIARLWDSGTINSYSVRYIAFMRNGGRFIGAFPTANADTTEAVKTLRLAT